MEARKAIETIRAKIRAKIREEGMKVRNRDRATEVSRDRSDRHALDASIRALGYQIHSRPKTGQPFWEKGGEVFGQDEVIAELRRMNRTFEVIDET